MGQTADLERRLALWRCDDDATLKGGDVRGISAAATCCPDGAASISYCGGGLFGGWRWKRLGASVFVPGPVPTCPFCGTKLATLVPVMARLHEEQREQRRRCEEREMQAAAERAAVGVKEYPPATCCLDAREELTHDEAGWCMAGEDIRFCPFCGTKLD